MAVAFGGNRGEQCDVPLLANGLTYLSAAAGGNHSLLVRSDGSALALGSNHAGQCAVPDLPDGLFYTSAAAGAGHSILLRNDGAAIAFGLNKNGQCDAPVPPGGICYLAAAAGASHSVLIRSDGAAVAFGSNRSGQCNVPEFLTERPEASEDDLHSVQMQHGRKQHAHMTCAFAVVGNVHSVLVLCGGQAVPFGGNRARQCALPDVAEHLSYATAEDPPDLVLTLCTARDGDGYVLISCVGIGGYELCSLRVSDEEEVASLRRRISRHSLVPCWRLKLILPSGELRAVVDDRQPVSSLF